MSEVKSDPDQNDCVVRCRACGHEEPTSFSYNLRYGWPRHCGATMTVDEIADGAAESAVADAFAPVRAARRFRS